MIKGNKSDSKSSFTKINLEAWRDPERGVRLATCSLVSLNSIEDQYIERPHSLRLVWHYVCRIGPVAVLRKIRSRMTENVRNRKIAAFGVGKVLDKPQDSLLAIGQHVYFFAPNHPEGREQMTVDARFILPVEKEVGVDRSAVPEVPPELEAYVGWSPFSGVEVMEDAVRQGLGKLAASRLVAQDCSKAGESQSIARERFRKGVSEAKHDRPSAVIFGLGNYAKTQIVPQVRRHLSLACVHEVDPDQLEPAKRWGVDLDTSPLPHGDECYDAWFISGYHHTHAEIAYRALQDNAYAVIEKPLATCWKDFAYLKKAVEGNSYSKLFSCFQKRYSQLNGWARSDLNVVLGEPVDMQAIVFEIPLPRLHWYNWPNSGSRLISNGCHWLDYFLFMNGYSAVEERLVWPSRGSDLMAFARLENGATLSLTLTDTGSSRLGVRDLIDLRAGDRTVRMTDATYYEAESSTRVLRRNRVNPMDAYGRMYESICRKIVRGDAGDDLVSLQSTELMLQLEDDLRERRGECLTSQDFSGVT